MLLVYISRLLSGKEIPSIKSYRSRCTLNCYKNNFRLHWMCEIRGHYFAKTPKRSDFDFPIRDSQWCQLRLLSLEPWKPRSPTQCMETRPISGLALTLAGTSRLRRRDDDTWFFARCFKQMRLFWRLPVLVEQTDIVIRKWLHLQRISFNFLLFLSCLIQETSWKCILQTSQNLLLESWNGIEDKWAGIANLHICTCLF